MPQDVRQSASGEREHHETARGPSVSRDADNVVLALPVPDGIAPGQSVTLTMAPCEALETARNVLTQALLSLRRPPAPPCDLGEALRAARADLGQARRELARARAEADELRRSAVCGLQLESPSGVTILDVPVTSQGREGRTLVLRLGVPPETGRGALLLAARKLAQG